MPRVVVPREVERVAIAVAMLEDQTVEEHKRERLFPILRDDLLVFPQSQEGAAAEANTGRLLQELDAALAGRQRFVLPEAGDERDRGHVNFGQSLRALVFFSGRPAFAP